MFVCILVGGWWLCILQAVLYRKVGTGWYRTNYLNSSAVMSVFNEAAVCLAPAVRSLSNLYHVCATCLSLCVFC